MRFDIKNLNIWKEDTSRNKALVRNKYKTITDKGTIYPIFLGDSLLTTDIGSMNLSVRSYNCLRRRGWNTVGDIINNISSIEDIRQIHNCGKASTEEIFSQIINLQKSLIPASDQYMYDRVFNQVNGINSISDDPKTTSWNMPFSEGRDVVCKIFQM